MNTTTTATTPNKNANTNGSSPNNTPPANNSDGQNASNHKPSNLRELGKAVIAEMRAEYKKMNPNSNPNATDPIKNQNSKIENSSAPSSSFCSRPSVEDEKSEPASTSEPKKPTGKLIGLDGIVTDMVKRRAERDANCNFPIAIEEIVNYMAVDSGFDALAHLGEDSERIAARWIRIYLQLGAQKLRMENADLKRLQIRQEHESAQAEFQLKLANSDRPSVPPRWAQNLAAKRSVTSATNGDDIKLADERALFANADRNAGLRPAVSLTSSRQDSISAEDPANNTVPATKVTDPEMTTTTDEKLQTPGCVEITPTAEQTKPLPPAVSDALPFPQKSSACSSSRGDETLTPASAGSCGGRGPSSVPITRTTNDWSHSSPIPDPQKQPQNIDSIEKLQGHALVEDTIKELYASEDRSTNRKTTTRKNHRPITTTTPIGAALHKLPKAA